MMLGAIVLAAGASRRLGAPKQLVRVDGVSLVRRTVVVVSSAIDRVCVVTGCRATEVVLELAGLAVEVAHAPDWEEGMAASLRRGGDWAWARELDALAVFTCDQVRLSTGHVAALVAAHRERPGWVVASRYAGIVGVPAVFPGTHLAALCQLHGDGGARELVRAGPMVAVDWPEGACDLDTPADVYGLPERMQVR